MSNKLEIVTKLYSARTNSGVEIQIGLLKEPDVMRGHEYPIGGYFSELGRDAGSIETWTATGDYIAGEGRHRWLSIVSVPEIGWERDDE